MKRHISIFAFLLCAFAAPVALAAERINIVHETPGVKLTAGQSSSEISYPYLDLYYNMYQDDRAWTAPEKDGYTVSWLTLPADDTDTQGANSKLANYTVKIADGKTLTVEQMAAAKRSTAIYFAGYRVVRLKYDAMPLTVTFDKNGGSGSMSPVEEKDYDSVFDLPANAFTKTGHSFANWTNAVGKVFEDSQAVKGADFWNSAITNFSAGLVAVWKANRHSVTCDLGNGAWPTAGYVPPAEASYGQAFSLPAPTRTGYGFAGWKVTAGLDSSTAKWGKDKDPSSQIGKDTLCINGDKEVYFKNLNPTNGAAVTLTAQWQAATITVTFNNHGGTSGGGIKDTLDVKYDAAYDALNPPTKGGSVFLGYEIDGVPYWNGEGQPVKSVWDIPTNCTADAKWNTLAYQLTYNENRSDGRESKIEIRDFEYGKPTKLYDGADFSNLGCTLLGWSTNSKATKPDDGCEIGGIATFVESKTLYAVWEKNYFIVYDGNGATNEMPMAVQRLVFGQSEQSLNPNTYGKVGYSFLGWATNRVAAQRLDWTYEDRKILKDDLATTLGETNTLFATWEANTYFIAFNPNGGTGAAMPVNSCKYDQPVNLPGATYVKDLSAFVGWSNDVVKVVYTNLSESVSNLCSVANGTNTLYAVWESALSDLSIAMNCDNLNWVDGDVQNEKGGWERCETDGCDREGQDGHPPCVMQSGPDEDYTGKWMHANISTNGTLSFWYRLSDASAWIAVNVCSAGASPTTVGKIEIAPGESGKWLHATFDIPFQPLQGYCIEITHFDGGEVFVDQMTWIPEGPTPEPEPVITNAVPVAITGLVYDGTAKTGVAAGANYTIIGNVATNAGDYTATVTVTNGVWEGGAAGATNIAWTIAKATYDMGGVTFASATYEHDGKSHSIAVAGVPSGVEVVYSGDATNRTEVGTNTVTASFKVLDELNYNAITTQMTATLAITAKEEPPEPPDPTVAYENIYFKATLAELGAEAVPTNRKITIKAEGLPKGLKLVTTALKDEKKRATGYYAHTVEGAPTETMDGLSRIAYVRVTDNKVQTLYALDLSVLWAKAYEDKSFPDGEVKSEYANFSVTNLWPDVAVNPKNWTFSGWPTGIKFTTKAVTSRKRIDGVYVTLTNALAYEVYGTPTKAGRFTVKAVEKIAGTSYKSTHVATFTVWPQGAVGDEWTNQAYVAVVRESGTGVKSASGLPTGIKFTAKDVITAKVLTAKAHTFYGTPTKAGTYAVTLTHEDKSKTQFLWTITPAAAPAFELKLTETEVDPATAKATIRQGVSYEWAVDNTLGSKVSASGLPSGLSLKSTAIKNGKTAIGYAYSVKGVPTKAGEYFVTFKTTMNGVTTVTTAAFTVLDLPVWAQGTFNGGADGSFPSGGQANLTLSKVGKLSGKWMSEGTNWTLSAASYDRYDPKSGSYVTLMIGKTGSGKKAVSFTNELFVSKANAEYLGGVATNALFIVYQNVWKTEPWKTIGKKFTKGGTVVLHPGVVGTNDTITLKFAASGTVTVAGKFEKSVDSKGKVSYYSVSASAVLCPQEDPDEYGAFDGVVFVYFPPKAKTPLSGGYSACVWVRWDGSAFAERPPASDE